MLNLWSGKMRFVELAQSLLVTAPAALFLIHATRTILQKGGISARITTLATLAALSPLLMHLWGWDMDRWNALCITSSFMMLYVASTRCTPSSLQMSRSHYLGLFLLIFLNGSSSIRLFDGCQVKQFPFLEHVEYLRQVFKGSTPLFELPRL